MTARAFATCDLKVQAEGPFGFAQGGPDLKPHASSLPLSLPLNRVPRIPHQKILKDFDSVCEPFG